MGNTPLPAATDVPFYRHGAGMPLFPEGDPRNDAWNAVTDPPSGAGANPAPPTRRDLRNRDAGVPA